MARLPEHFRATPLSGEAVSRDVLAAHQRERVLELATAIFAKRGYRGTTVDDLLAGCKIGFTNFYAIFEGKEDCFLAAFDRTVAATRGRIAAAGADGEDWAESSWLGMRELVAVILAEPLPARLVLVEAQGAGQAALDRYNELLDEALAWLRRGRRQFPAAAGLPPGFEQAAVAGLAFYLQQCLLDSRPHEVDELAGEAAGLVLGPIVGEADLRRLAATAAA